MWKKFDAAQITGTRIFGDPRVPETRWWLLPLLIVFLWKKRVIFSVAPVDVPRGYRIGYKPSRGPARLLGKVVHDRRFQVRVGYEDCTFFAVSPEGHEVPIRIAGEPDKSDASLRGVPLY